MAPGRRIHLGEQILEECRQVVAVVCLPPAIVNPGIRKGLLRRRDGQRTIVTGALHRIVLAPAFDVNDLTGFGPVSHDLGDQLSSIQRTSPALWSADPRQRIADEQIDDSGTPEARLEQDQPRRILGDAADRRCSGT
jgi:hypothetical protein